MKKSFTLILTILISNISFAQSPTVNAFLDDATWYTDKFITPSTDAAVYICSANWITTAKKQKLYTVNFSVYANLFFVPKNDRDFTINNNNFKFFTIKDNAGNIINGDVAVPTVFGNDTQYKMEGTFESAPVKLDTPQGINRETVPYPYFHASISLWKGFDLSTKFSTKLKYNELQYQVYGFGVKHNFSQYFKKMEARKMYLSSLLAFSKEQVSSRFINANTPYGTLGLNEITGKVSTWQLQFSGSKEWKNFELVSSIINNYSSFEYILTGERGTIEDLIPVQSILNDKLKGIYTNKFNIFYEISGRYKFNDFYIQSSLDFGKFFSASLSLQYDFNAKH